MAKRSRPAGSKSVGVGGSAVRRCIYVASPYSIGDQAVNVRVQLDAAHRITEMGHLPFAPLLNHLWHLTHPRSNQAWLDEYCLPWVERCDLLLRLPGTSPGADLEVNHAINHGIEPCFGWEDLEFTLEN